MLVILTGNNSFTGPVAAVEILGEFGEEESDKDTGADALDTLVRFGEWYRRMKGLPSATPIEAPVRRRLRLVAARPAFVSSRENRFGEECKK